MQSDEATIKEEPVDDYPDDTHFKTEEYSVEDAEEVKEEPIADVSVAQVR